MAGTAHPRPAHGLLRVALVLGALAALAALAFGPHGAAAPERAFAQGCGQPAGLAPDGPGPSRFTMLVRINQQNNVNAYTNFDVATGGLGSYMRPQDVFVINTRFETTTPAVAYSLATQLRNAFPCNRIIGLNGMGFNPAAPGYALSLYDHPAVWGLMTDFEPMDWNGTRASDPGRPPWVSSYKKAFPRIKQWNGRLAGMLNTYAASRGKRGGLVPIDFSSWNYGRIAQDIDKKNRRLGGTHIGPLSVQTQNSCADGGASAFRNRAKQLFDQYRYKTIIKKVKVKKKGGKTKIKKVKKRRKLKPQARPLRTNLSLQISFSDTPNPNAGMAITKTSAKTAAACARAGLKAGGGAFFFFASDDSMRLLFKQPEIASLRPGAGAAGSGGVSPK